MLHGVTWCMVQHALARQEKLKQLEKFACVYGNHALF
jgi:hypothetical protein